MRSKPDNQVLRYALMVAGAMVSILLFLLASASANSEFLGRYYGWLIGLIGAVAFVLASPSGRARSFWTLAPWKEAAAFVAERRHLRERAA